MTEVELSNELKRMYEIGIPKKEQTTMIHEAERLILRNWGESDVESL
jgi:hypothetical protein